MSHYVPALNHRALTPLFDALAAAAGVGPAFKSRVVEAMALSDGDRVLELGCGTGVLAAAIRLQRPGCVVTAVDIDADILEIARLRLRRDERVLLLRASAEQIPIASGAMDAAVSTLVLHNLPLALKRRAFAEVARVLRPGGSFHLVDIGPRSPHPLALEQEHSFRWAWRANSAASVSELLADAGFAVTATISPRSGLLSPWVFAIRALNGRGDR